MATVTATLLGTYRSKVTAAAMSSASGSVDVLTIPHQLGTIPDEVRAIVRSVTTLVSGGTPVLNLVSYNASQAVINFPPPLLAVANISVDVICELTHSTVR